MRMRLVFLLLVVASALPADELADRAEIEHVINVLTDPHAKSVQRASLFTADAQDEMGKLADLDRRTVQEWDKPWSEVTAPRFAIRSIRFITSDVAMVDVEKTQYGSTNWTVKIPVLLVLKREPYGWRVAAIRTLLDFSR